MRMKIKIRVNKRILLLVVSLVAVAGLVFGVWQKVREERRYWGNLLKNFNFEIVDASGKLQSWAEDDWAGWLVNTQGSYEGRICMQATVGWSRLWQEVPARQGKYYTFKAYLKSDIVIPTETNYENAFLSLECLNEKGEVVKSEYGIVNASSSWKQKMRQIYTPPETRKIRVILAKRQGEGSVWFDNIELKESSSALLANAGFEVIDDLTRLDAWVEDPMGGWSVNMEEPYKGNKCAQATVSWSWLSQEIPARPRRYYVLSVYLKSDIAVSEEKDDWNTFLALQCLDKERKVIAEQIGQLKAAPFWELGQTGLYAPKNTDQIRIKLAKRQGQGSVWFDNLKITESAWYMKIELLRRILEDKPFFIFYFSIYFILLILLLRIILKKQPARKNDKHS